MNVKEPDEASWKALKKKLKLDLEDDALVKALARLGKTDGARPEPRIQALGDVIEQSKKQLVAAAKKKKELGDKPFNEIRAALDDFIDASTRLQKETRATAEAAAAASKKEEEDASPALLTTQMMPLVRELRRGDVRMPALVCTTGRQAAVLIMRRAISPSKRPVLSAALHVTGGAKFLPGECLFEKGALTFVLKVQGSGLARLLKAALLAQLGLRLNVRVRGEGPEDADEDLDD